MNDWRWLTILILMIVAMFGLLFYAAAQIDKPNCHSVGAKTYICKGN